MLYDPKWEVPAEAKPLERWQVILLEAAAIIEQKGHCKGALSTKDGFCLLGAIGMADCGNPRNPNSLQGHRAVSALVAQIGSAVGCWNDTHSAAHAIAVLRRAALRGD